MADVVLSTLTGSNLHYPRGFAESTQVGEVPRTTGAGAGSLVMPTKLDVLASQSTSGALTINLSTATIHRITLTGNVTSLSFSNPPASSGPYCVTVVYVQDGTGSRTVTHTSVKWAGGAAPTLTTTAAGIDVITYIFDGTNIMGFNGGLAFA